jgi:hypothetical protein
MFTSLFLLEDHDDRLLGIVWSRRGVRVYGRLSIGRVVAGREWCCRLLRAIYPAAVERADDRTNSSPDNHSAARPDCGVIGS